MANYGSSLVVGVFSKGANVKGAVDALRDAGFDRDQIGVAAREGGIVTSTLLNDLVKLGVPQDRAGYYDSEFKNGNTVVSVRADGREREASDILRGNGAYDYDTQGTQAGYVQDTTQAGYTQAQAGTYDTADTARQSMQLREEVLQADKQRVQTGEARLHKDVISEEKTINVPVNREEVFVERHAVEGGSVSDTPIGQDEVIRVPVSEEQVNVTKTPVVTGEVAIGKRAVQENQQVTDTVRREEAHLEKDGDPRIRTNEDLTNQ